MPWETIVARIGLDSRLSCDPRMKGRITMDEMCEDNPVVLEEGKAVITDWVSFVLWEIVKCRILA